MTSDAEARIEEFVCKSRELTGKGEGGSVTIEFTGANQFNETVSAGSSEVILPVKG